MPTPMSLPSLREQMRSLDAKVCHQDRLLRLWLQALPPQTLPTRPEHHLPARLLAYLSTLFSDLQAVTRILSRHPAQDGSIRLLVGLQDGQTVETVLLPGDGLCVSVQAGCAVGCLFCMTGRSGLARQLSSLEILAQVVMARQIRPIRKVVFMGMGEPAHNLESVLESIELLGGPGGFAHKSLVLSTVGDHRLLARLSRNRVKPALAVSLHSSDPALRARLLPRAPAIEPEHLVQAAETYARQSGYPTQYQWTLLHEVNDTDSEVEGIRRLLTGKYAVMNLIPFNSVAGAGFSRPPQAHCERLARQLNRLGILTKLRRSAGQDIDAGCGQLRARMIPIHAQSSA
jgi:23S rRNA (adenine2503-C2)-methyltransferase